MSGFNKKDKKKPAVAFLNYWVKQKDGTMRKAKKGIPLTQNEAYPDPLEDALIEAAKENGGTFDIDIVGRVQIVTEQAPISGSDLAEATLPIPER